MSSASRPSSPHSLTAAWPYYGDLKLSRLPLAVYRKSQCAMQHIYNPFPTRPNAKSLPTSSKKVPIPISTNILVPCNPSFSPPNAPYACPSPRLLSPFQLSKAPVSQKRKKEKEEKRAFTTNAPRSCASFCLHFDAYIYRPMCSSTPFLRIK